MFREPLLLPLLVLLVVLDLLFLSSSSLVFLSLLMFHLLPSFYFPPLLHLHEAYCLRFVLIMYVFCCCHSQYYCSCVWLFLFKFLLLLFLGMHSCVLRAFSSSSSSVSSF